MARPLRVNFAGALYHVMSRGIERRRIVRDDRDRQTRLDWLRRTVETYGWRLHAFVLLDNHEHLFVETPTANLSAGMQYLNSSYTGYFNRRHRRVGHLFQGRFKGHLVDQDGYFLEVSRYLHLNPVRAHIVERPDGYVWSSYRGYLRKRWALDWVCYERVLGALARDDGVARRAYARYVCSALDEPLPSPFASAVGGLLLGSQTFVERMRRQLAARRKDKAMPQLTQLRHRPPLATIAATVAQHFGADPDAWQCGTRHDDAARAVAACLARHAFGYSAKDVARALGYRSHGSVRSAILRAQRGNHRVRRSMSILQTQLANV